MLKVTSELWKMLLKLNCVCTVWWINSKSQICKWQWNFRLQEKYVNKLVIFLANDQEKTNQTNQLFPVNSILTREKHLPLVATAFLTFHYIRHYRSRFQYHYLTVLNWNFKWKAMQVVNTEAWQAVKQNRTLQEVLFFWVRTEKSETASLAQRC